MALIDKLNNLGDAVRDLTGTTEKMTLEAMAEAVRDHTCPAPVVEDITITENGTYTPNEGVDGFNEVIVDIPEVVCPEVEPPVIEALAITENGVYTAPSGIDGYSPITVNVPSGGIEIEPIVLSGSMEYACSGAMASKYIELFGDTVSTKKVTNLNYAFKNYKNDTIPFDINCSDTPAMGYTFEEANIKELPRILNCKPSSLSWTFYGAKYLKEIPDEFCDTWDWSYLHNNSFKTCAQTFYECWSLRKVTPILMKNVYNGYSSTSYSFYAECFNGCHSLDEIKDLVVSPVTYTSNTFRNTFTKCFRLKELTFETNEDGTPKTASWSNQTIALYDAVGYGDRFLDYKILNYNSGITADKEVKDDATYQVLKDDPDYFTFNVNYSRYNHDSAVNTINSLPDTSAYLATAGGTNTIKFKGASGSLTDEGAINTLTEEEIAVAAAKGWTVSLS